MMKDNVSTFQIHCSCIFENRYTYSKRSVPFFFLQLTCKRWTTCCIYKHTSKCRIDQHLGISSRKIRRLVMHSLPRIHAETSNHKIPANDVSIMDYSWNIQNLPTLKKVRLESPQKHHPTLHIIVTCEVCIALQPGYISNLLEYSSTFNFTLDMALSGLLS